MSIKPPPPPDDSRRKSGEAVKHPIMPPAPPSTLPPGGMARPELPAARTAKSHPPLPRPNPVAPNSSGSKSFTKPVMSIRTVPPIGPSVPQQDSEVEDSADEFSYREKFDRRRRKPSIFSRAWQWLAQQRDAPPWLISLVIHVAFLLVLAAISFPAILKSGMALTATLSSGDGDAISNLTADFGLENVDEPSLEAMAEASDAVKPTTADIGSELAELATSAKPSLGDPSVEMGLAGRSGSMKGALLSAYGGTAETEDAVTLGLKWLVKSQQPDGGWSMKKPYTKPAINEDRCAATSMALLAFLGAGNTHREGPFKDTVKRGVDFLLELQDDGFFAKTSPSRQKMYAHGQATIAICELYALTKDSRLHAAAEAAVKFCIESQHEEGGWRYEPREDRDLSVTGWYVMALMSARMAGLAVNQDAFYRVENFLKTVQRDEGAFYSYQDYDTLPSISMTAEGLLCRQYLGWRKDDLRMRRGVDEILNHPIDYKAGERSVYYWYYATQVLHHLGGDSWRKWNETMRVELPARQIKTGGEAGSWDPTGDAWGQPGGRMYATCLSIYCLEVYYRHMPLYGLQRKSE